MHSIGIISEERLQSIPVRHWKEHEFCFHLHDQLLHMLTQYEESGAHNVVLTAFREAVRGHEQEMTDVDIVDFLKKHKLIKPYEHFIGSHVALGLTADMLHFLCEALHAFERRKFSVGFALLRKPLKEHILYMSWLLADKDDFLRRFEANNYESLNNVSKERRIELFRLAIDQLATENAFSAELLWDMIYSKSHSNGFEPTCQRATHLITSKGDLLRTEDYSFNFIFEGRGSVGYYEFIYSKLPYLLLYIVQVALELFNRIKAVNSLTYSHLVLTTMGCYEALFIDWRSQHIGKMLNRDLGALLECTHCESQLKITKANAPSLYLTEHAVCRKCGLLTQVPLYWLFGKAKVRVIPKSRNPLEDLRPEKASV